MVLRRRPRALAMPGLLPRTGVACSCPAPRPSLRRLTAPAAPQTLCEMQRAGDQKQCGSAQQPMAKGRW